MVNGWVVGWSIDRSIAWHAPPKVIGYAGLDEPSGQRLLVRCGLGVPDDGAAPLPEHDGAAGLLLFVCLFFLGGGEWLGCVCVG